MLRDRTGLRLHLVGESRASADMTVKNGVQAGGVGQQPQSRRHYGHRPTLQTITRTDSVINVDTSANVRSTQDAIHVSIDLDVRINGLATTTNEDGWSRSRGNFYDHR